MSYPISLEVKELQKAEFLAWYAGLPEGKYLRSSLRASFKRRLKDRELPANGLEFNELAKSVKLYQVLVNGLRCYQKGGLAVPGKLLGDAGFGVIV